MSKLDELIAELCPDGVEYKILGKIATCQKLKNKNHVCDNAYSITQRGLIPTNDFFGEKTQITSMDTSGYYLVYKNWFVYSPSRIDVGSINYLRDEGPVIVSPLDVVFNIDMNIIKPDFLLNILLSHHGMSQILNRRQGIEGTGRKTLPFSEIAKIEIPVPPLEVQSEIIRILDTFTELIAGLTAELTARKKQYEYYRDKLFGKDYDEMLKRSLQNNVKVISLNELGNFSRGKRFVRSDIREEGTPCIHYGDLYTYYGISAEKSKYFLNKEFSKKMRYAHKGDVIIVQAGENDMDIGIGVSWIGAEDVVVHDACFIFEHNINPKYISHYLRTSIYHLQIKKYVSTGKICSISAKNIGKALIPVPPLVEQERIVGILDHFDTLCNDISSGLPAEIEARKKQYEYYRDRLLSFK